LEFPTSGLDDTLDDETQVGEADGKALLLRRVQPTPAQPASARLTPGGGLKASLHGGLEAGKGGSSAAKSEMTKQGVTEPQPGGHPGQLHALLQTLDHPVVQEMSDGEFEI